MSGIETESVIVVTDKGPDIQTNTEPSKSGKALVGIIYPPLEIRNIVDKTASFVARNGPEFESRIKQHETNNPRFNFLTPTDPYHAYYQHKVKEFAEGKGQEPQQAKPILPVLPQKVQEAIKAAEFVPKEPPPEFEFVADPATINAFDLDLIKLTACFVARNGRQFLTQLMTREARNYQFDFLKPQHSNFGYFTKLVEQYTKILLPPKNLIEVLRKESEEPLKIVLHDIVKYRVDWERHQRRLRERQEAEVERERVAYAQIDWHDFVVVQTVDFQPHEAANLPPPCTPKDVGARILAQQRLETTKTSAQTMEMEVESGGESDNEEEERRQTAVDKSLRRAASENQATSEAEKAQTAANASQQLPLAPNPENVVIRTDYNPRNKQLEKARQADQKWVISPLTGEKILADKLAEHMRFNTVDSQYLAQKERQLHDKLDDEPVFAPGVDISANIVSFAERRSDIFGVGSRGAEQTVIGKKLGEEDAPRIDPKAIWDGHSSSIESTTKAAQSHITIEEQIAQIHRAQGLLADQERIGPKTTTVPAAPGAPPPPAPTSAESATAAAPKPTPVAAPPRPAAPFRPPMPQPAFTVRPAVVPIVQVGSAPVLLVPQPQTIMPVGQFVQSPFGAYAPHAAGAAPPFFGAPRPPMMPGAMTAAPGHAPPPPATPAAAAAEEPAAKRARLGAGAGGEEQLVDEAEWLKQHGGAGPVTVSVACPVLPEKADWRLSGQAIAVTIDLTDTIATLKAKIQDATNLPVGKQKLVYDGMFVKDSQSLAYYNLKNGSSVQLQLKERGGRKK